MAAKKKKKTEALSNQTNNQAEIEARVGDIIAGIRNGDNRTAITKAISEKYGISPTTVFRDFKRAYELMRKENEHAIDNMRAISIERMEYLWGVAKKKDNPNVMLGILKLYNEMIDKMSPQQPQNVITINTTPNYVIDFDNK